MKLIAHPRLYLTREMLERYRRPAALPFVTDAKRIVTKLANRFTRDLHVDYDHSTHNAHLIRARFTQFRIITLLAEWSRTGDTKYRDAVMQYVDQIAGWEHWSWIAWRRGDKGANTDFDLSCGENSATLALVHDVLHDTLSAKERNLLRKVARERCFKLFIKQCTAKDKPFWHRKKDSNWNTVCAGGAGMLALAMMEEEPLADRVLKIADDSIEPYMRHLDEVGGAWPEGIGYWNYGMAYAFRYLLSHENATGKQHPMMKLAGTRKTIDFPFDLSPNGVACSFGDINNWKPCGFAYALAQRYGRDDLYAELDERLMVDDFDLAGFRAYGGVSEIALLHPGRAGKPRKTAKRISKHYPMLDWYILADQIPKPNLCATIRGGTVDVPHGQHDLLSFHLVVKDEALINNITGNEYLDTTFSKRRFDLFELNATSKNGIFINGVGVAIHSRVESGRVTVAGYNGVLLNASNAFGSMRDGPVAKHCARLFVMLDAKALLVVDRVIPAVFGRSESRFFSEHEVTTRKNAATIKGNRQRLRMTCAADQPATLFTASGAMTSAAVARNPSPTMLRWCSNKLIDRITTAALFTPGTMAAEVRLSHKDRSTIASGSIGRKRFSIVLPPALMGRQ